MNLQRCSHKLSLIFWPIKCLLGANYQGWEITWAKGSTMAAVPHTRNVTSGYINALSSSIFVDPIARDWQRSFCSWDDGNEECQSHQSIRHSNTAFLDLTSSSYPRERAMFTNLSGMAHISALCISGSVEDTTWAVAEQVLTGSKGSTATSWQNSITHWVTHLKGLCDETSWPLKQLPTDKKRLNLISVTMLSQAYI